MSRSFCPYSVSMYKYCLYLYYLIYLSHKHTMKGRNSNGFFMLYNICKSIRFYNYIKSNIAAHSLTNEFIFYNKFGETALSSHCKLNRAFSIPTFIASSSLHPLRRACMKAPARVSPAPVQFITDITDVSKVLN